MNNLPAIRIDEALKVGLRASYKNVRNGFGMSQLLNARPDRYGLYPFEPFTSVVSGEDPPYPQLFWGPTYKLAFYGTEVYESDDWIDFDVITFTDSNTDATTTTLPEGGIWHFAPFQNGWIACNDECTVYSINETFYVDTGLALTSVCTFRGRFFAAGLVDWWNSWQYYGLITQMIDIAELSSLDLPGLGANWIAWSGLSGRDILWMIAPHRAIDGGYAEFVRAELTTTGDLSSGTGWTAGSGWSIGGGVATASGASGNLSYALSSGELAAARYVRIEVMCTVTSGTFSLTATNTTNLIGPTLVDRSGRAVWYAEVTGTSSAIAIDPTTTFTGEVASLSVKRSDYDKNLNVFRQSLKTLDSGFRPMDFQGELLAIKPLHEGVVAYSTGGVAGLTPASGPIPTVAYRRLSECGVISRGAVAGNLDRHVFIDAVGQLRTIDNSFQVQEFGREEFFSSLLSGISVVGSYDQRRKDCYFTLYDESGQLNTYLVTETGVAETGQSVISLTEQLDGIVIAATGDDFNSASFIATTDFIDFGGKGLKTVCGVSVSAEDTSQLEARLIFRLNKSGDAAYTPWKALDELGEAQFNVTCYDAKLSIRAADYSTVRIHSIELFYENKKTSLKQAVKRF